jgi:hypothetical protein
MDIGRGGGLLFERPRSDAAATFSWEHYVVYAGWGTRDRNTAVVEILSVAAQARRASIEEWRVDWISR